MLQHMSGERDFSK